MLSIHRHISFKDSDDTVCRFVHDFDVVQRKQYPLYCTETDLYRMQNIASLRRDHGVNKTTSDNDLLVCKIA